MKIPVFHDDQHGTSIIVGAAILNGLRVVGKDIARVKLVVSGRARRRSPASICWWTGPPRENIWVSDIKGVVYAGRKEEMDPNKARYAKKTDARTLAEVIAGADVFLGLSAGARAEARWLKKMATKPLILALANPEPEILPDWRRRRGPTRSSPPAADFPNQVNNVLCFPFIFRGALDVARRRSTRR